VPIISSLLAAFQGLVPRLKGARKSQRFAVSATARLRLSGSPGDDWEKVTLDNLSLGGAFVHTASPLPAKSKIDLLVNLDGTSELELRARVIYARSNGTAQSNCGLRFVDLSYDRYRALIAFVNDREKAHTIGVEQPTKSRLA
jgi:c-di-GMP-binding flagellar brake protein YcgR